MMRISAVALFLACSPLHAGDVHVWVDSDGRRQISDVVPEKYRSKARRVVVPDFPAPVAETRSAAAGGSAQPIAQPDPMTQCYLAWQRYNDSRECLTFVEGDPRANCPVVPVPSANCPPP